jgi:hypothetical protein
MSIDDSFELFKNNIGMLTEYKNKLLSYSEVIEGIKKDCKPFLKHKQFIFRGMDGYEDFGSRGVRKSRESLGMLRIMTKLVNTFLNDHHLPLRNESVFCTASESEKEVALFGKQYVIFPKGNFKHVWFSDIIDFNTDERFDAFDRVISHADHDDLKNMDSILDNNSFLDALPLLIDYLGSKGGYSGNALEDVTESLTVISTSLSKFNNKKLPSSNIKNEIIVECNEYYYVLVNGTPYAINSLKADLGIK